MVTPYAFHVAKSLFGTPLARPLKRACALLIDAAIIGLLSQASDILLAFIAAITFFRAGNRLKMKKRFNIARISLRFVTAILIFVIAVQTIEFVQDVLETPDENQQVRSELIEEGEFRALELNNPDDLALIGLTAKYLLKTKNVAKNIEYGKCIEPLECWTTLGQELASDLASLPITKRVSEKVFDEFRNAVSDDLTPQQKSQLEVAMTQAYEQAHTSDEKTTSEIEEGDVGGIDFEAAIENPNSQGAQSVNGDPHENFSADVNTQDNEKENGQKEKAQSFFTTLSEIEGPGANGSSAPSILDWVQGIAADLGLGFGWAAFYFSIFTAWWSGQTPGKRLLGIKVIKLDGSALNLWESFGRYGGYGAGIATGLLGFLQIYWDPNRQAIQDKISETLVIDLRNESVEFVHPYTSAAHTPNATSNEPSDKPTNNE
nr:RDD family protein [Paraglaciecola sp. 20A4]